MLVRLPWFVRNHARASRTHVFRHALLRCCVNIQSGQIDGHMHWRPIFSSAHFATHGAPHSFPDWGFQLDVAVGSTARKSYASNPVDRQEVSRRNHLSCRPLITLKCPATRQLHPTNEQGEPAPDLFLSTNRSFSASYIAPKSVTRLPLSFGSVRTHVPSLSSRRPP